MTRLRKLGTLLVLPALAVSLSVADMPVRAQGIALKEESIKVLSDKELEASAVVMISATEVLVANDKDKTNKSEKNKKHDSLAVVSISDGNISRYVSIGASEQLPDWEAMAKVDPEGKYYLVGSDSKIYTFEFGEAKKLIAFPSITIVRPANIKEVEGLAARKLNGTIELSFGIRDDASPTIRVYRAFFNDKKNLSLTPFFHFDAPKQERDVNWHLSSIEYVPELCGFLILTTTEKRSDNTFYGNRIWFVAEAYLPGADLEATSTKVEAIGSEVFKPRIAGDEKMKAEGLVVLSYDRQKKSVRLAIVYDNDFYNVNRLRPKTGLPGKLQIVEVSVTPSP